MRGAPLNDQLECQRNLESVKHANQLSTETDQHQQFQFVKTIFNILAGDRVTVEMSPA